MPHGARKRSKSGYYHIVPKGIADQIIFENDADRELYVRLLYEAMRQGNLLLHAYVLMSNHTHLIVEDTGAGIADAMKYLHERYGTHFAEKTGRTGGILRRPYWSEPIETNNHLLCAVRYVHANPSAAGICPASAYAWSSAKDYLGRDGIAYTETVLDMLGGRNGFIEWSKASNGTAVPFSGSKLTAHLSDSEALEIARGIMQCNDTNLAKIDEEKRDEIVVNLHERGFSNRQITRITGVGPYVIKRILTST
ncbi:MAG: transposase [Atopobiaceae bacterium]|nr:transposase [Atopobiaceae bacterium]